MTATATLPASDSWTAQLEQLRARYKHLRPAVLGALNVLLHDPDVSDDDAKARANLHGVRITAASLNAARTVLSRMDSPATETQTKPVAPRSAQRQPRRPRATDAPLDAETLIKGVVAKLQSQGSAEAERLRETMRKAIALLQAAVG